MPAMSMAGRLVVDVTRHTRLFGPGQLGPVKAKLLADAAYNARLKGLAGAAERNLRLPSFVMDCHYHWAVLSLLMPVIEAASAVG